MTTARTHLDSVVVRFAGDSGDGMQLTGDQFSQVAALAGNDLATFPDYPAEIRAPAGTTYGVSAYQINFGSRVIKTSGDAPDVLVALNPAALKVNIHKLRNGGALIVDSGSFTEKNLKHAAYDSNPLEDGSLDDWQLISLDIHKHTLEVTRPLGLGQKDGLRCKNMWVLGLVYWMYDRDPQPTLDWLKQKFADKPEVAAANCAALKAGHAYAETAELQMPLYHVPAAQFASGLHTLVSGSQALSYGLLTGAHLAGLPLSFCSYPITPSSPLLHALAKLPEFAVTTFQAEDEIAAVCAAIGASYAGSLGVTASSGPGLALKTEALGLAISTELPLVVVDTQRGGPSTGLPTKTEQSDLYIAIFGRNGDAPIPVLAARSPADCFYTAIEAVRLATRYMTPVILLSDGYISNAAEPWHIPDVNRLAPFPVKFRTDPQNYQPYQRNPETLARDWVKSGTPELMHRIGGIEKDFYSGNISYDPANHQRMTEIRAAKIDHIVYDIPEQTVCEGPSEGDLLVLGWGSTYGPISRAVANCREQGLGVAHAHIRHLWPLPANLGTVLSRYQRVLLPEMNNGQLATLLRSQYDVLIEPLNKISGQPFTIAEIETAIRNIPGLTGAAA